MIMRTIKAANLLSINLMITYINVFVATFFSYQISWIIWHVPFTAFCI